MHSQYLARRIIRRDMMLEALTRHSLARRGSGNRRSLKARLKRLLSRD